MKLKDKKVNIYRETFVPNGSGYTTKVIEPVASNVWAYFRQLSGSSICKNSILGLIQSNKNGNR